MRVGVLGATFVMSVELVVIGYVGAGYIRMKGIVWECQRVLPTARIVIYIKDAFAASGSHLESRTLRWTYFKRRSDASQFIRVSFISSTRPMESIADHH